MQRIVLQAGTHFTVVQLALYTLFTDIPASSVGLAGRLRQVAGDRRLARERTSDTDAEKVMSKEPVPPNTPMDYPAKAQPHIPRAAGLGSDRQRTVRNIRWGSGTSWSGAATDMGIWLVVAAFLPYLVTSSGLRGEHLVAYSVGLVGVGRLLVSRIRQPVYLGPIVAYFGLSAIWVLFVTLSATVYEADTVRVIAEADYYVRPAMIALGITAWVASDHRERPLRSLRRSLAVLLSLLAVNAVVSATSLFADISWVLAPFRALSTAANPNVADLALQNGRFSGIFNQPFEAGVAYSLGLFAWAYLFVGKGSRTPRASGYLVLALLVVGGVLPASKAFLLGGLPLFLVYWTAGGGLLGIIRPRNLPIVAAAAIGIVFVIANWTGGTVLIDSYQEAAARSTSLVSFASAGRFGGEGLVASQFGRVALEAPLTGFGLNSLEPLDSAYLMYFVHGGMLPLLGYLVLLGWLVGVGMRSAVATREGRLLLFVVVYMIGAGLGAPVASTARSSTVLWTIVDLLVIVLAQAKSDRRIVQPPPARRGDRAAP